MNKIEMPYEIKLNYNVILFEFKNYVNYINFSNKHSSKFKYYIKEAGENLKNFQFSQFQICLKKAEELTYNRIGIQLISQANEIKTEFKEDYAFISKNQSFAQEMIDKGYDGYIVSQQYMNKKQELQKQQKEIEMELKKEHEKVSPFLQFSVGLASVLIGFIFFFVKNFFNNTALYHLCGFLTAIGLFITFKEMQTRESIGWKFKSPQATSKRAFNLLLTSLLAMVPLSILFHFFASVLVVKILFFIQIYVCTILFINGISLLILTNVIKTKEKKFNIGSFVLSAITIVSFVIQLLQIFKVI